MATSKTLHTQHDLFSSSTLAPVVDRSFSSAKRVQLDAHSWIEVVPGWLSGSQWLFENLQTTVSWKQHDRRLFDQTFHEPRLTSEYRTLAEVSDDTLLECVQALSDHYGIAYDSLWLNLYRDGQDSTGFHRDRFSCRKPECVVPVLTLGATRRFLIKPREGGASMAFKPGSGDLIVMGGRAQQDWVHGVPKDPSVAGPRVSVNFQSSEQAMST